MGEDLKFLDRWRAAGEAIKKSQLEEINKSMSWSLDLYRKMHEAERVYEERKADEYQKWLRSLRYKTRRG
jgi:hypothetical protein